MSIVDIRVALETAINNMPGIIPSVGIVSSAVGNPAIFTTDAPHKLKTGLVVKIEGHQGAVPAVDGSYYVVANAANTFSLQHIVGKTPLALTAPGVGGVIIAKLTAWDNTSFKPLAGVPSQRVNLIWATPENPSYGDRSPGNELTRESGFVQITLFYPLDQGTLEVSKRAQLIKSTFPRGSSFSSNGITVHIEGTPDVMIGMPMEEHYALPVRIPFWADVYN